jgi:uncharacterized protein YkwD
MLTFLHDGARSLKYILAHQGAAMALRCALAAATLLAALPAHAQQQETLIKLINAYRAARSECGGRPHTPAAPLVVNPALNNLQVASGALLDKVLERRGYLAAEAEAIYIAGPADARAVMAAIAPRYCATLLSRKFSAIGAGRTGDAWLIVLARPAPPNPVDRRPAPPDPVGQLPGPEEAGKAILAEVNLARAAARTCGALRFAAAPAVTWNGALGSAALVHSRDMAEQGYFSHQGKDGRAVADRAQKEGYRWRSIGENIAAGQSTPAEVVAGWLSSPGHCANIMNGSFTEMGAGYAVSRARTDARAYWTQVLAAPR